MSGSDHVPIGVVIELRRPRLIREQYRTDLLKDPRRREEYQRALEVGLKGIEGEDSLDRVYKELPGIIKEAA